MPGSAAHRRGVQVMTGTWLTTSGGPMQMCQRRILRRPAHLVAADENGVAVDRGQPETMRGARDGRDGAAVAVMAAFVRVPGGLACVLVDVSVRGGGSRQRAERRIATPKTIRCKRE